MLRQFAIVSNELVRQAIDHRGANGDGNAGIDERMKEPQFRPALVDLERGEFQNRVSVPRVESRGLGIENHVLLGELGEERKGHKK